MQRRAKDAEQAVSEVIAGQLRLRSSDIILLYLRQKILSLCKEEENEKETGYTYCHCLCSSRVCRMRRMRIQSDSGY